MIPGVMTDVVESLRTQGVVVTGAVESCGGVKPAEVWPRLVGYGLTPVSEVDDESETYLAEVDQKWRNAARQLGVLDKNGACALAVPGVGAFSYPWLTVEVPLTASLSGALVVDGEIEFISAALDGSAMCGVTTQEYGVWVVDLA